MAKVSTPVNKDVLVEAIRQVEHLGPLANRGDLHQAVASKYNATFPKVEITHSIVQLRIKEWKLEVKTPLGKRGRAAGIPMTAEHKAAMQAGRGARRSRGDKFAADPEITAGFAELKKNVEERFQPLVDKVIKGSMRAAVTLQCLDCTAYQPVEIRNCVCNQCPLFAFRPYKSSKAGDKLADGQDGEGEEPELEIEEDEEMEEAAA